MISILTAAMMLTNHGGPSVSGAVPCGQIRTYIQAMGFDSAINGARQHGATEQQIAATIKRCNLKPSKEKPNGVAK